MNKPGEPTTEQPRVRVAPPTKEQTYNIAQSPSGDLYARATYDGKELRPFTGRKGSMDAYKLPSKGIA